MEAREPSLAELRAPSSSTLPCASHHTRYGGGARSQRAVRRGGVVVEARCPAEGCVASATAPIKVPAAKRAMKLAARKRALGAGQAAILRATLNAHARRAVRRALRAHRAVTAKVRVTVAAAAGNPTIAGRTMRLSG